MAGWLVLALLALVAVPAAPWATPAEEHAAHAALDRHSHGHPHGTDAAPARHGEDRPAGEHRGAHPALACCVAMHCPMLAGVLPGAPAQPSPPAGPLAPASAAARRFASFEIPPALPPPRAA